jgi:hypothetical protein
MNNSIKKNSTALALLLTTSSALANTKTPGGLPQPQPGSQPGQQPSPPTPPTTVPAPTGPKVPGQIGGKTPLTITSVTLDEADKQKVQQCAVPNIKITPFQPSQGVLSLAFDPKNKQIIKLHFAISTTPVSREERVLALLYSRCLVNKPQIQTPLSRSKLVLDINDVQILSTYNVPVSASTATPPAAGTEAQTPPVSFDVDLELDKLRQQVNAGNDTFYFQAALMNKTDFEAKNYSAMSLSPVEAIHVATKTCPTEKTFSSQITDKNKACAALPAKSK